MKKHYHVLQGMHGGYMPDVNEVFSNRADAENYAKDLANDWRNDLDADDTQTYRVTGNKHDGYEVSRVDSEHDLGSYIEIVECYETDCESEID